MLKNVDIILFSNKLSRTYRLIRIVRLIWIIRNNFLFYDIIPFIFFTLFYRRKIVFINHIKNVRIITNGFIVDICSITINFICKRIIIFYNIIPFIFFTFFYRRKMISINNFYNELIFIAFCTVVDICSFIGSIY